MESEAGQLDEHWGNLLIEAPQRSFPHHLMQMPVLWQPKLQSHSPHDLSAATHRSNAERASDRCFLTSSVCSARRSASASKESSCHEASFVAVRPS